MEPIVPAIVPAIVTAKQQARSLVRARRRDLVATQAPGDRDAQAAALSVAFRSWLQSYADGLGRPGTAGLTITAFRPLASEPPVGALIQDALADGMRVLLPVTVTGRLELSWVPASASTGDGVAAEVMRGVAPTGTEWGPEVLAEVDVALIPGLAVDAAGHRLGQGGGYYDRALPALRPQVPVIVALHDHELPTDAGAGSLPHAAHDIPVNGVLTTAGVSLLG